MFSYPTFKSAVYKLLTKLICNFSQIEIFITILINQKLINKNNKILLLNHHISKTVKVVKSEVLTQPVADFIIIIHNNDMADLNLKEYDSVILENTSDNIKQTIDATIIKHDNDKIDKQTMGKIQPGIIGMDQTCRNTILLDDNDKVIITKSPKKDWLGRVKKKYSAQKAVVRVQPNSTYMERKIPVMCICDEMLISINAAMGDQIKVEFSNKDEHREITVRTAPLTPNMQKFHDSIITKNYKKTAKVTTGTYFGIPTTISCNPDRIHPVFLDKMGRKQLNIEKFQAVKIRRSKKWNVLKKLNEMGLLNFLALSLTMVAYIGNPNNSYYLLFGTCFAGWVIWSILTSSTYNSKNSGNQSKTIL